jgi:tetratricopeptide (TPR) repeat protein
MVNNLGYVYYKQGIRNKDKKSFEDAERYLREAVYRDRKRWQAHLNLADLYSQTGRKDEAQDYYQKAIELNPNKTLAAKIKKKIDTIQQRVDKAVVLGDVREKISNNLPAYGFRILGDSETGIAQRIIITDTATDKVIQDLDISKDSEEMESRPGDDFLTLADINFDGYKDINLLVSCGATGNCNSSFWLFDPHSKKFVFSKDFDGLGTFTLDPKNRQISTHSNGGHAGMIHSDDTYEVRGNKPVLIREIDQNYDDKKGYYVEVTKELVDGEMKVTGRNIVSAQ